MVNAAAIGPVLRGGACLKEPRARRPREGAESSAAKRRVPPSLLALAAALLPLFLILFVVKPADVVYIPSYLAPNSANYSAGIQRAAQTSDSLINISIAIVGAAVFWYLRDRGRSPRYLVYAVFVLSLVSIYSGIKLGYSASITLATAEPDLMPLLSLLRLQAVLSLSAGLLLSGIVVFGSLKK